LGGFSVEGYRWIRDDLQKMQDGVASLPPAPRAKAWSALSYAYVRMGDNLNSKRAAENAVAVYQELGDKEGLATGLLILSLPLGFLGEHARAETAVQEAMELIRQDNNAFLLAWAFNMRARNAVNLYADPSIASGFADQAIRIAQEAGIDWWLANAYQAKGLIAERNGEYDQARLYFEQAILVLQEIDAQFNTLLVKSDLAHLERQVGNLPQAVELYRETIQAFRDAGQAAAVAHQLECFGFIALAQNQEARAAQLFAAGQALRQHVATPMTPEEQPYFDEQLKDLQQRMNDAAFEVAWAKGSRLSMDDAISLALDMGHVWLCKRTNLFLCF